MLKICHLANNYSVKKIPILPLLEVPMHCATNQIGSIIMTGLPNKIFSLLMHSMLWVFQGTQKPQLIMLILDMIGVSCQQS